MPEVSEELLDGIVADVMSLVFADADVVSDLLVGMDALMAKVALAGALGVLRTLLGVND